MASRGRFAGLLALFVVDAGAALAQSTKLIDVISGLYGGDGISLAVTTHPLQHPTHFREASAAALTRFNEDFGKQLRAHPLAAVAPTGTLLAFDPTVGGYVASTPNLGPLVLEPSTTIGAGRWDLGLVYASYRYDSFDGDDLDDIRLSVAHRADSIVPDDRRDSFENDRLLIDLDLVAEVDVLTLQVTYGLTNNLDLSVAVPVLSVDLRARSRASILEAFPPDSPFATTGVHAFDPALDPPADSARGDASGVGDMVLGLKYHLSDRDRLSLGTGLAIKLATGDRFDLLGTGTTVFRPYGVADLRLDDRWTLHGNLGAEAVNDDGTWRSSLRPQAGISVGGPRYLAALELGGRYELNGDGVGDQRTDLNLGAKWRPRGPRFYVVSAGLLVPLDSDGLRADTVLTVGISGRY